MVIQHTLLVLFYWLLKTLYLRHLSRYTSQVPNRTTDSQQTTQAPLRVFYIYIFLFFLHLMMKVCVYWITLIYRTVSVYDSLFYLVFHVWSEYLVCLAICWLVKKVLSLSLSHTSHSSTERHWMLQKIKN